MNANERQFETAFSAYIECALWSSTDESTPDGGEPIDANYDGDDINTDTLCDMRKDLADFIEGISEEDGLAYLDHFRMDQLGHDFWLTRNGHGAGFWDRGLGDLGERLTKAAEACGSYYLYVGDDGKIYGN